MTSSGDQWDKDREKQKSRFHVVVYQVAKNELLVGSTALFSAMQTNVL